MRGILAQQVNRAGEIKLRLVIDSLHDNDVLSQKNYPKEVNSYTGNRNFQELIGEYSRSYHDAKSDEQRKAVAEEALAAFTRRYPTTFFVRKMGDKYAVLQESSILSKVSRELQEQLPKRIPFKRKRRSATWKEGSAWNEELSALDASKNKKRQRSKASEYVDDKASYELGRLAQRFMSWAFEESTNRDIDVQEAANHLNVQKRRIEAIVDILEGAGVMKRNSNKAVRLVSRQEFLAAFDKEERFLETWIDIFQKEQTGQSVSPDQLATLVRSKALVVHTPAGARLRTIHLPNDEEDPFAFQLIMPPSHDSPPIAYVINRNDATGTGNPTAPARTTPNHSHFVSAKDQSDCETMNVDTNSMNESPGYTEDQESKLDTVIGHYTSFLDSKMNDGSYHSLDHDASLLALVASLQTVNAIASCSSNGRPAMVVEDDTDVPPPSRATPTLEAENVSSPLDVLAQAASSRW